MDIRAETVADAFFSGWIARFGTPASITTDRGAQFESKLWDGLCNQFGIVRNRTMSYHPQSNSMVERFHRQLKAAIMAHESPNSWTITLPSVLLGVRSAVKELLGRSAAKVIYGTTLRLSEEFTQKYTVVAHTNLDNYSDKLRVAISRLRLCPPHDTHQKNIFQYKEIDTCTHVFLQRITIAPPLTAPYDGPDKVIVRSGRVMKILIKGKVETVPSDGVKPAHFECEPATGTTTQRTTPSKITSSKTTGIVRGKTQDPLAPYVAPHSRTPAVSRANGSDGGLRTYSHVPLYLRGKISPTSDTRKQSNVKNGSNIADSDKIVKLKAKVVSQIKINVNHKDHMIRTKDIVIVFIVCPMIVKPKDVWKA